MDKLFQPFDWQELADINANIFHGYEYCRKHYALLVRAKYYADHTREQWIDIVKKYGYKCCKCNSEVIGGMPTKDHIIPTIYGGTNSINNVQPLCRQCNTSKGRKIKIYRYLCFDLINEIEQVKVIIDFNH